MSSNRNFYNLSFKVFSFILFSFLLASCGAGKKSIASKKSSSAAQEDILTFSKKFLGKPYRYAGKGPNSFDCSGYTSFVFRNFGYKLHSSSSGQDRQFPTIAKKEDLVVGDLVFFEGRRRNGSVGHVGIVSEIYPNNTFKFIHASTSHGVIISSSTEPYYSSRYLRGGRVLEDSKLYANTNSGSKVDNRSMKTEPNTLSPAVILVQNNSIVNSSSETQNISANQKKKSRKTEKSNNDENQKYVESNSDIILREDSLLVPPPQNIHIVKMGETLYSISQLYGCSVEELKTWNPKISSVIKPGDKLQVNSN